MFKKISTTQTLLLVSSLMAVTLLLVGCETVTGRPLKDMHSQGQFDDLVSINKETCLTCHNENSIIKATNDFAGKSELNIHQPSTNMPYGDCYSCHQINQNPVLTCNAKGCHEFKVPSGWQVAS